MKLDWQDDPTRVPADQAMKRPIWKTSAPLPDGLRLDLWFIGRGNIKHVTAERVDPTRRTAEAVLKFHTDSVETAKRAAENWADSAYPLHALAQLGRENPDKDLLTKLRRVEALRKGATTPGERRAAEQAYERLVRRLEKEYTKAATFREIADPKMLESRRVGAEEARKDLSLLSQALRSTFGSMQWGRMDAGLREELAQEAYERWLSVGRDPSAVKEIANSIRRERRASLDRDVGIGAFASDEIEDSFVMPEEAQAAGLREAQQAQAQGLLDELAAQGPLGKIKASLVELHLGESVIPGQPSRFKGKGPRRDLEQFHPPGGQVCPTCRAIARFVRVQGMTPDTVGRNIDEVLVQMRQELGE